MIEHTQDENRQRVRRLVASAEATQRHEEPLTNEWLVTNGLGGYAAGTISGLATRRYHGLLIAAMPAPLGRQMLLSHLSERVRLSDQTLSRMSGDVPLADGEGVYGPDPEITFQLEWGLPVWHYRFRGATIEKRIVMPHEQNTVFVVYRLLEGDPVRLKLLPSVHNRSHDAPVNTPLPGSFRLTELDGQFELSTEDSLPTLRMQGRGSRQAFTVERQLLPEVLYALEESRGYERFGTLWSPGYFRLTLTAERPAVFVASAEPWNVITAMDAQTALQVEKDRRCRRLAAADPHARDGVAAELVLAADQFLVKPVGRAADAARVHAQGDEVRTVIAGYHWFTDWGRDTMISLEGLTLVTGRASEAGDILRTFAFYVRDGLLPNLFPEGKHEGLYHTADATLWFFHAIDRYLAYTDDWATVEILLPQLIEIAKCHLQGTRFGIGVDANDGLLSQGEAGYQLTWMDAKVEDWVVTPRRGKAVEINALWYNALMLLADWVQTTRGQPAAEPWREHAARARIAFNRRFWYDAGDYLYDVVDGEHGDDPACRPNQIFAISLHHAVLDQNRWPLVLDAVEQQLLTPYGLRSLAPDHPDYHAQYYGDRRARDAAYHQGTVWAWLIGPFLDAWLRVHPEDRATARQMLAAFDDHLNEAAVGTISEIFDAEPSFTPRGCVAQAWSVAEVLRAWVKVRTDP